MKLDYLGKVKLALIFGPFLFLSACNNSEKNTIKTNPELNRLDSKSIEIETTKKALWNNPMISPIGRDLVSVIRGYYLVGEFDKMLHFVIPPKEYNSQKLKQILQNSTWGYEIKVTNIVWKKDSSFLLTVKTIIQNTTGVEYYKGKIVNDTAKLILYPDSKRLFIE